MSQNTGLKSDRLFAVDLVKAISITAVVSFHSTFVPETTYPSAAYLMDILFSPLRFCVPVLFTISFMLLQRSLEKYSDAPVYPLFRKRFIRFLIPSFFWMILAAFLRGFSKANSTESIFILILQGKIFPGAYYLWVMIFFLPIFILFNSQFKSRKNLLMMVVFQLIFFGLIYIFLSGTFQTEIPLLLRSLGRSLFLYWFVYMPLGAFVYRNWGKITGISKRIPLSMKGILILTNFLIMAAEYSYLKELTGGDTIPFEYSMFSCILSVPIMLVCFASNEEENLPISVRKTVKFLSKYSLGIFCINGIISLFCLQIGTKIFTEYTFNFPEILAVKLVGWSALLLVSLALSVQLDKVGLGACVR